MAISKYIPTRANRRTSVIPFPNAGNADTATLSLDFTAMSSLDSRFTFSRTSPATYINSSGYVTSAAINAPRFDYDPTTLTPRGLLIEGSSVNYVLQSGLNPFSAAWTTGGSTLPTITAGYTGNGFAPDNTSNPTRVQFAVNSGSASRISQGTSYTTNPTTAAPYTVSVWMKSNTAGTNYTINILGTNGSTACTVTPTWQRFTLVNTSGTSLVGQVYISNESGSVAADVLIWGAQLERGAQASSYIPTGSSTVERTRDEMTMANISAINFNQRGGTVFMRVEDNPRDFETFPYFAAFEQSPSGRGWAFGRFNNSVSSGRRVFGIAFKTNNSTLISSSGISRPSGQYKFAASLDASLARMAIVVNGGAAVVNADTAATMTTIGSLKFNNTTETGATEFASVWVAQLKYWPTIFPNETLRTITT
jgi:hypothetical protein